MLAIMKAIQLEKHTTFTIFSSDWFSGMAAEFHDPSDPKLASLEDWAKMKHTFSVALDRAINFLENFILRQDNFQLGPVLDPSSLNEVDIKPLTTREFEMLKEDLKIPSERRTVANLCRFMLDDGDIRWVCQEHFDRIHGDPIPQQFLDIVEEQDGRFERKEGLVQIKLQNEIQANKFYKALTQVKGVQELDVSLCWDAPWTSFKFFAEAALKTSAIILAFKNDYRPKQRCSSTKERYGPLMSLLALGRFQVVKIQTVDDLFGSIGNSLSTIKGLSSIRRLTILQSL